jgi:hypothetical protein
MYSESSWTNPLRGHGFAIGVMSAVQQPSAFAPSIPSLATD